MQVAACVFQFIRTGTAPAFLIETLFKILVLVHRLNGSCKQHQHEQKDGAHSVSLFVCLQDFCVMLGNMSCTDANLIVIATEPIYFDVHFPSSRNPANYARQSTFTILARLMLRSDNGI